MTDLISRQEAIALIKLKMYERKTPFTSMEVGFWHGMIFCIEALTNMPSAETPDRCETGTEARDLLRYKP